LLNAVLRTMAKKPTIDLENFPTLEKFAKAHNLRQAIIRDSCGEQVVIPGKPPKPRPEDCCHIFEHGPGRLGVSILTTATRAWNGIKKHLLSLGFELHQDGDYEGILLFDPENPVQAKAAKKAVRVKPPKLSPEVSPEEHARRVEQGKRLSALRMEKLGR